jgi:CHAT domain-containing protein/tetratricopeptide (TPR) repeat protein
MNFKSHILWFSILFICTINNVNAKKDGSASLPYILTPVIYNDPELYQNENVNKILEKLNSDFQVSITSGDTSKARTIINSILKELEEKNIDSLVLSNSLYYVGVYNILAGKNEKAIDMLLLSSGIRELLQLEDEIYAKCLYNLGVAYNNIGDFRMMEKYTLKSTEIEKEINGNYSPLLLRGLSSLVTANYGLSEYNKAISFGNKALQQLNGIKDILEIDLGILYGNIGICYTRLSDYSKAAIYLEKAESVYNQIPFLDEAVYINLLNNLAANYFLMGLTKKSDEYFNRGFEMARTSNSIMSLNFLNSFAIVLAKAGKVAEGEELILNSLAKAKKSSGPDSKDYFEVLKNYAEYLREYKKDMANSRLQYEKCMDYLETHDEDIFLKNPVILGYAIVLTETGDSGKALDIIQQLLFSRIPGKTDYSAVENPQIDLIEPDQWSLDVLKAKYRILWDIFKKSQNWGYLLAASGTSELIVDLLDKVRINISEEDSRLILGDRYRDFYLFAIRDFEFCFRHTGDPEFREKAFEFSEKSKVAGLLASTRELKATQFHIPDIVADLERRLKTEIGVYNAKIAEEDGKKIPNATLLAEWKEVVFEATSKRDSLIKLFEKQYPDYYLIKYNTRVVEPDDIPDIAGRNTNYLNYVVSDTVIYIFLTNRKFKQLITVPVDSGFFNNVREFRSLLSMPSPLNDAKSEFIRFQQSGISLYNTILGPVRKYLISDKLLISPDNILSYIPFETIPVSRISEDEILYKDLPFLMNDFRISYTYSATLLAESAKKGHRLSNRLVAFAPVYTGSINADSLLLTRDVRVLTLQDLPFARQEAEYVSTLTGGKLCINDGATEAAFKALAGDYDIIHLAMHTILNDQYPMHSKMLFYQSKDSIEDGYLNTFEVYDIPLKAKMVILSSCNTGTGILNSGEGILSLARGFIYSGSQSVIMSMWEIEDRSGTEIVENFYRHLKRGESKSKALRKARLDYLKNADMLRSHPYFWSSLIIYGNNEPLFYTRHLIITAGAVILAVSLFLFFYFHKFR